jgi:hypothetical protein
MKNSSRLVVGIVAGVIVVAAVAVAALLWWNAVQRERTVTNTINSYDECVTAGYPVMESYPEQCAAGGKTFTRDISGDTKPNEYTSEKGVKILINTPTKNQSVSVPFTVSGQVPGNWSFEASFPVELLDKNGNSLTTIPAQLTGDWMTTDLVPFTITFDATDLDYVGKATLVLHKDNPSGLSENDDNVTLDITLQ